MERMERLMCLITHCMCIHAGFQWNDPVGDHHWPGVLFAPGGELNWIYLLVRPCLWILGITYLVIWWSVHIGICPLSCDKYIAFARSLFMGKNQPISTELRDPVFWSLGDLSSEQSMFSVLLDYPFSNATEPKLTQSVSSCLNCCVL